MNVLYTGIGITLLCILIVTFYFYGSRLLFTLASSQYVVIKNSSRWLLKWLLKWISSHIVSIKMMNERDIAADMIMSKIGDSIKEFNIIQHTKDNYIILEIPALLTPKECDEIVETAKAVGMEDSEVTSYDNDFSTKLDENQRKSKQVFLQDSTGPLFEKIANITQKITKLPIKNQEMLQIVSYEEGGRFDEHFDGCIYDDITYCNKINRNAGERKATLLMYLNDNFEGGETEFVYLDIKIKPKKGKAILFINTTDDQKIIGESLHCGHPVYKGQKWICTKWIHFKEFI